MTLRNNDRRLREILENPTVSHQYNGMWAGILSPAASLEDLEAFCYGVGSENVDVAACMSHACAAFAASDGAVLVIVDRAGTTIFGQIDDPGLDPEDPKMSIVYRTLVSSIHKEHTQQQADETGRRNVEYPIIVMPRHRYDAADATAVVRYGDYLVSCSRTAERDPAPLPSTAKPY